MTNRFNICINRVLGHEGGYVNHPSDPGGETNWGISKRSFPNVNIKKLTRDDAIEIYRKHFWQAASCDLLPESIDFLLLDSSINHGIKQAVKFLQRAVGVKDDGIFGPKTLQAVNKTKPETIIRNFCDQRLKFYKSLSTYKTFGRGWSKRIIDTRKQALSDLK